MEDADFEERAGVGAGGGNDAAHGAEQQREEREGDGEEAPAERAGEELACESGHDHAFVK